MSRNRMQHLPGCRAGLALLTLALMTGAALCGAAEPASASASTAAGHPSAAAKTKKSPAVPIRLIDINSASRAQLKTLPGVGNAEVDKIIAGRPYLSKAELVTKKVIPTGPYLSLKNRIIAMQKIPPKSSK